MKERGFEGLIMAPRQVAVQQNGFREDQASTSLGAGSLSGLNDTHLTEKLKEKKYKCTDESKLGGSHDLLPQLALNFLFHDWSVISLKRLRLASFIFFAQTAIDHKRPKWKQRCE